MMPTYRYTVTATCRATVTETWVVSSHRPLEREAIDDAVYGEGAEDINGSR